MYKPPTKEEARMLLSKLGLTEQQAAKIINASIQGRGSSTISRYKTGASVMPWPVLYTLANNPDITQENWRDAFKPL